MWQENAIPHRFPGNFPSQVAAVLITSGLFLSACGRHELPGPTQTYHEEVAMDQAELTRVELRMGAGKLNLHGGAEKLMEGDFTYNVESSKPVIEHHSTGSRSDLIIRQPEGVHIAGPSRYEWDVRLSDTAPFDVAVHLGAGDAEFSLSSLNLRNVQVDMGVGKVDMDLRGMPQRSYDVRINGGVGEARVRLPEKVGIIATASGGIGAINVSGLEQRNGRWTRRGEENNPIVIRVDVKGGVGEIRIDAD